jgi:hypothetical protein
VTFTEYHGELGSVKAGDGSLPALLVPLVSSGYNDVETQMTETMDAKATKRWAEFLASSPPDSTEEVEGLFTAHPGIAKRWISLTPDVRLYCDSEECKGYRFFECNDDSTHVVKPSV